MYTYKSKRFYFQVFIATWSYGYYNACCNYHCSDQLRYVLRKKTYWPHFGIVIKKRNPQQNYLLRVI